MSAPATPASTRRFLRRRAVRDKTGLPDSTMYYLIAKDLFPKPVKLTAKISAWPEDEIDRWMDTCVTRRDAAA